MNPPWTPESAAYAATLYEAGHSIVSIAEALVRTPRSITSKLTQLGLYRAQPKPTREPTKAELVGELCEKLGLNPVKVHTLVAASHEALTELVNSTAG